MEIIYFEKAEAQLKFFKDTKQDKLLKKIRTLLENILQTPYSGLGKPEALKHELSGLWSRRINREHRLVYQIGDDFLIVHSLKGHYL